MIGVLLYREHDFVAAWNRKVAEFVTVFFLPVFFTYTGLRTNLNSLDSWSHWGWAVLIICGATFGKFAGSWIAARWSGLGSAEASCLGIDDEHPGPHGTGGPERGLRSRSDSANRLHHVGPDGHLQHRHRRPSTADLAPPNGPPIPARVSD